MRSFRIGAFLVLTVLVGAVAAVAYNLGVSAGLSDAAVAAGATVITAPATISPLGIIVGGFFLLLFIGFLARVIAGPRRHMAPGGWGWGHGYYRHWDGDDVPERFRPMLERWHSQAHTGGATPDGGPASGPGTGAPTPPPGRRPPTGGPTLPTDQPSTGA